MAPDVMFGPITAPPSQGERCCHAGCVFAVGRVQTWKHFVPTHKGFLLFRSKPGLHPSLLPPQGLKRLYPELRVLQQHLRSWAVKSIPEMMLSSYMELYILKALY